MTTRLTDAGVEQPLNGAAITWEDLLAVTATTVDHMTQRVPQLAFAGADGTTVELGEGASGWDAVVADLGARLPLAVPDLDTTLSLLRSGEVAVLWRR